MVTMRSRLVVFTGTHVIQWYAMMPVPPQLEPGLSLRLLRPVTTTTSRMCFLRATHFQWQSMSLSLQCIVFTGAFGRSTDPKVFISLHCYDTGSMTDLFEIGKEGILLEIRISYRHSENYPSISIKIVDKHRVTPTIP